MLPSTLTLGNDSVYDSVYVACAGISVTECSWLGLVLVGLYTQIHGSSFLGTANHVRNHVAIPHSNL